MATGADFCSEDLGPVQVLVFRLFRQGAFGDAGSPLFILRFYFRAGEKGKGREGGKTVRRGGQACPQLSPSDILVVLFTQR